MKKIILGLMCLSLIPVAAYAQMEGIRGFAVHKYSIGPCSAVAGSIWCGEGSNLVEVARSKEFPPSKKLSKKEEAYFAKVIQNWQRGDAHIFPFASQRSPILEDESMRIAVLMPITEEVNVYENKMNAFFVGGPASVLGTATAAKILTAAESTAASSGAAITSSTGFMATMGSILAIAISLSGDDYIGSYQAIMDYGKILRPLKIGNAWTWPEWVPSWVPGKKTKIKTDVVSVPDKDVTAPKEWKPERKITRKQIQVFSDQIRRALAGNVIYQHLLIPEAEKCRKGESILSKDECDQVLEYVDGLKAPVFNLSEDNIVVSEAWEGALGETFFARTGGKFIAFYDEEKKIHVFVFKMNLRQSGVYIRLTNENPSLVFLAAGKYTAGVESPILPLSKNFLKHRLVYSATTMKWIEGKHAYSGHPNQKETLEDALYKKLNEFSKNLE